MSVNTFLIREGPPFSNTFGSEVASLSYERGSLLRRTLVLDLVASRLFCSAIIFFSFLASRLIFRDRAGPTEDSEPCWNSATSANGCWGRGYWPKSEGILFGIWVNGVSFCGNRRSGEKLIWKLSMLGFLQLRRRGIYNMTDLSKKLDAWSVSAVFPRPKNESECHEQEGGTTPSILPRAYSHD